MNSLSIGLKIQENVPLAPMTTLKIGGAARFFVRAEDENQVREAFNFAEEHNFPLFVLGGGSNVLIADEGFDGLVLQIALRGIEVREDLVTAQAGEDWDEFVSLCVEKNLAGIECLSGIPGLVGGAPIQNVGAYGQEVSETIRKVRVFDRKTKEVLELQNADCKFSYRSSIFNTTEKNRFIVLSVTYQLKPGGQPKIVYKDLIEFFNGRKPCLQETRQAVCQIRAEKAMLVRQDGPDAQSAGSFFKNPIVTNEQFAKITKVAQEKGVKKVPCFPVSENQKKIPAAWLIETSGFYKGYQKGNAGISTKHALALTNRGNATAKEMIALKNEIQKKVKEIFAVELVPEPALIGF
jgi:UDP-N-acetylmuramate dehydrogenase